MKQKNLIIFLLEEEKIQPLLCAKTQINFTLIACCNVTKYEQVDTVAQCNFGTMLAKDNSSRSSKSTSKIRTWHCIS